jgi:hypothetical protein
MENDSIRASGGDTLIDLWIEGKLRAISITRAAIEAYLVPNVPAHMSDTDRCEFVRTHLPELTSAVKKRLVESPAADAVIIDAAHFAAAGERRKGDRRKGERRKVSRPPELLPHGERRRGDRRKSDRRKPTPRET